MVKPLRHPWRRYFARSLDWMIYAVVWELVCAVILHISWDAGVYQVLNWAGGTALMLLLEPLLLSRLGTTPGKALFGLQLRAPDGGLLTYDQAVRRTYGVFWHGMGWNLPLIGLYFSWRSYQQCMEKGKAAPWDENAVYTLKDTRAWRCVAFVLIFCLLPVLAGMGIRQAVKPSPVLNAGPLTREAFIENINAAAQYDKAAPYRLYLDGDGVWKLTNEALTQDSGAAEAGYGCTMTYEILMEDAGEYVAGVRIYQEGSEGDVFDDLFQQTYFSYMALWLAEHPRGSYSQAWKNYYHYNALLLSCFREGGTVLLGGVRLQMDVVNKGMAFDTLVEGRSYTDHVLSQPLLFDDEGQWIERPVEDTFYACTVTLTREA